MNDRYLYRAKQMDNGEWIGGYLYGILERRYILWGMTNDVPDMVEVDPSTICQCTGLKDKNGKLIWENDIMIGYLDDIYQEDATYVRVMWRNNGFHTHQNGYDDFEILDEFDQNNFEVCGNIFDNPELLELD